jgi:DNA invertase Pin-like site-specific DNA recombinase
MNSFEEQGGKRRRIAIYIRVSTEEQVIDGYSLEAQRRRLVEHVKTQSAQNWETNTAWIYSDAGHSGADLSRPELDRLRKDVQAGKYESVLVWKIDRLSRNLKHLLMVFEEFEKAEVSFMSLQENIDFKGPIGKLIFQIFGAIAQFERELIKGRTLMGRIASAQMGNYTGTSIPYGYKEIPNPNGKGKKLGIVPVEQKWVRQMYDWYIYEGMGFGQIAERLNKLQVPKNNHRKTQRAGMRWTGVMVQTILKNTIYKGQHLANIKDESGKRLPDEQWTITKVPPCVSELIFMQAQQARAERHGKTPSTKYLLSGKLVDMDLDKPLKFSGAKRSRGGFSYRRKQFDKDGVHYSVFEVPGQVIEDYVWSKIKQALREPEIFIKQYLLTKNDPTAIENLDVRLDTLRERLMNEELAIERIEMAYEDGRYSQEKMDQKKKERIKAITDIEEEIQKAEGELHLLGAANIEVQKLRSAAEQVDFNLDKLDKRGRKILCDLFIKSIEMRHIETNGERKVRANIVFQFNPDKLYGVPIEGRMNSGLHKTQRGRLGKKTNIDGGQYWT